VVLTGCSVFGVRNTPEPGYRVVATVGAVEIRAYGPQLAASVIEPGDEIAARAAGFRRLARYIFGGNTAKTSIAMTAPVVQAPAKIAMTAPVVQRQSPGGWTISFTMPQGYTLATLPEPNDPGIRIVQLPPSTDAVYRFSGIAGSAAVARASTTLLDQLRTSSWVATGTPVTWFYDPPWTLPWLRRNEIAVPVTQAGN
jgi:hypothetical protein